MKPSTPFHFIGVGDFQPASIQRQDDPCPLPSKEDGKRKRTLSRKEVVLYAPMSNIGKITYDKDAMYVSEGESVMQ